MPRFRGAKNLTCFYCGMRSSLKFDGTIRDFPCLHCEATNYLDQNGEITDPPPVDTDREAAAVQYAAPQSSLFSSPQDEIFCQMCLKNQHLFTKSLAQYLPDDPSDPDYLELERNYYRYRRNLEKRYPQVCGDCAGKVETRIRQAGYTAKTDHLRRMMTLSRGRKTKSRTRLDWVDNLGKALWRTGFVLQMLWHFVMILQALQPSGDDGMYDPDDRSTTTKALSYLTRVTDNLPVGGDLLMQWSLWISISVVWWNPHFIQVNRGFTRHLLGFTQWYSFQGLVVFFRFIFREMESHRPATQPRSAKLGAHAGMACVMALIYMLAGRSIHVNTAPLFATCKASSLVTNASTPARRGKQQQDSKSFSELFNDALDSANATPRTSTVPDITPSPQSPFSAVRPGGNFSSMRNVPLAETPSQRPRPRQQLHYDEEMDWSPITPQHRALDEDPIPTPTSNRLGRFNAPSPSPSDSKSPFWYRIPAAPVEPARRLRNPVWSPAPNQKLSETGSVMFSRRGHKTSASQASIVSDDVSGGVEFKQPSFFAPERDNDASSLADLLSQSFSLGQERESTTAAAEPSRRQQAQHRAASNTEREAAQGGTSQSTTRWNQAVLTALLALWLLVMFVPNPYRSEVQLFTLLVAGVIALRGTGDTGRLVSDRAPAPLVYILSALGIAELAAVCWVGSELWTGRSEEVGWYGAGVMASMLGHQVLSLLA